MIQDLKLDRIVMPYKNSLPLMWQRRSLENTAASIIQIRFCNDDVCSECLLFMANWVFFYIITRTSYIWYNDSVVHFVLGRHA
jgi:hypothetical protein